MSAEGYRVNYCADCFLQFESAADFANHREKFCVESEYADPAKLEAALKQKEAPSAAMTFADVQLYLSASTVNPALQRTSLHDLKAQVTSNDSEMQRLRQQLQRDRAREKADEIRALKHKQQQALLQTKLEEDAVVALLKEIEARKQDELRARLAQEQIKKQLQALDLADMASLEDERKRELAELSRAKAALLEKEQAALRDIEALEKRVKAQELHFRAQERELEAKRLGDVAGPGDSRQQALRRTHMERSREAGAAAATREQKRRELEAQQAALDRALGSDNQVDAGALDLERERRRVDALAAELELASQASATTAAALNKDLEPLLQSVPEESVETSIDHLLKDFAVHPQEPVEPQESPERRVKSPEPRAKTSPIRRPATPSVASLRHSDSLEGLRQQQSPHPTPRSPTPTATPSQAAPSLGAAPQCAPAWPPHCAPAWPPQCAPAWTSQPMGFSSAFAPPGFAVPGPPFPPFGSPWGLPYGYAPSPFAYPPPYAGLAGVGAAIMGYPPYPMPFAPPPGGDRDPETAKLQAQLDQLKQLQEQREFEQETERFQQLLQSLHGVVPIKAAVDSPPPAAAPEDSDELHALRLQHAQAMLRLRHERDLLEEQEKLQAMKDVVEKRRKEAEQQQEHEAWLANQKRMVVALRMKKALAKEQQGDPATRQLPYDPDQGFLVFWDFATGVPLKASWLQLTYALYDLATVRSKHKVVRPHECELAGPSSQRCIFATRRDFEQMAASATLRLVVEVAAVAAPGEGRVKPPVTLGWTAMDIFLPSLELQEGLFKLPLSATPLPQVATKWALPAGDPDDDGTATLFLRIAHAAQAEEASGFPVNPLTMASKYALPPNQVKTTATEGPAAGALGYVVLSVQPELAPTQARARRPTAIRTSRLTIVALTRAALAPTEDAFVDRDLSVQRRQVVFARGDGVNVYVDGARSLPDATSATKLTAFAFHADMSQCAALQETSALSPLTANAFAPDFNLLLEYRDERFNPTLTLLVRVDTVNRFTKEPIVLGYAALPIFLNADTKAQPTKPSVQEFVLNEGAFQVPLHVGVQVGSGTLDMSAQACDAFAKVPCATVLLRIARAPKSEDGLRCLSRKEVPLDDWDRRGVVVPPPAYASGAYDSVQARPSATEGKMLQLRTRRKRLLVADALASEGSGDELQALIANRLEKKPKTSLIDSPAVFAYEPEVGFRVAVDGLHNVAGGVYFKVLTSIAPPGSFYNSPRLTDDVQMTVGYDWTSAQSSPEFTDGFSTFRDVLSDAIVVLFDVRSVKQVKDMWVSAPLGWAFLKLLPSGRCIVPGAFQLPLYAGEITAELLQNELGLDALVEQESAKKKGLVAILPGASVLVRVEDAQFPNVTPPRLTNVQLRGVPEAAAAKYTYDAGTVQAAKKKKPLSKLLPPKRTEREVERELNVAFAKDMGIGHYSF
ncbi:hypothetical protein ACHHYP_14578 [Achlya hypogyna]|uniref:Uncharacterized protein n=1 Tax=Achlya hypogyna TaxID=1202772 RepID=A0A1V9YCW2_ACHHY|nr:hypothetical protein ACHHYP_14578 [Achlya hypogyna]